jgi:phosphoesterase RecJ-like protein
MKAADILAIQSLLETPKKIVIVPHRNPDGDAMGSTLALFHYLQLYQHEVVVISPNEFPEFLAWLPAAKQVLVYEKDKAHCSALIEEAALLFTLDFNALHRTGEMEQVLKKAKAPFILIDHHEKPDTYAQFTFSDTSYGSTCEMIYDFIEVLGDKAKLNTNIATCIYTGILTDSGSFRFPKTTGRTHRIAGELIDLGVENSKIPELLFDNSSFDRLQLMGRAFQNMKVFPAQKATYTYLTQADLDEFHYQKGDTEGIVNYGLSIQGIVFTAIFIEHRDENLVKISFRSQGDFNVNEFARQHFSGGGHINAAGGKSEATLVHTLEKYEKLLAQLNPS